MKRATRDFRENAKTPK